MTTFINAKSLSLDIYSLNWEYAYSGQTSSQMRPLSSQIGQIFSQRIESQPMLSGIQLRPDGLLSISAFCQYKLDFNGRVNDTTFKSIQIMTENPLPTFQRNGNSIQFEIPATSYKPLYVRSFVYFQVNLRDGKTTLRSEYFALNPFPLFSANQSSLSNRVRLTASPQEIPLLLPNMPNSITTPPPQTAPASNANLIIDIADHDEPKTRRTSLNPEDDAMAFFISHIKDPEFVEVFNEFIENQPKLEQLLKEDEKVQNLYQRILNQEQETTEILGNYNSLDQSTRAFIIGGIKAPSNKK